MTPLTNQIIFHPLNILFSKSSRSCLFYYILVVTQDLISCFIYENCSDYCAGYLQAFLAVPLVLSIFAFAPYISIGWTQILLI